MVAKAQVVRIVMMSVAMVNDDGIAVMAKPVDGVESLLVAGS